MNLSQLSNQIPTVLALAERVGLQRRRSLRRRRAERAGYFGAGLALGSGLAVLLSPKSGPETRSRLRARLDQAREYVTSNGENAADSSRKRVGSHAA